MLFCDERVSYLDFDGTLTRTETHRKGTRFCVILWLRQLFWKKGEFEGVAPQKEPTHLVK